MVRKALFLGVVIFIALLAFLSLLGEDTDQESVGSVKDIFTTTDESSPFRALGEMFGKVETKAVGSAIGIFRENSNQTVKD